MYGLEVCELIIVGVDASAKEEAGIAAIYDFGGTAKLDKVGLVLLVSRSYKTVDLDKAGQIGDS